MPVLPSSLALTTISDGALATAADVRNNFTAIQTAMNAMITDLAAGTAAGQVLSGNGSTLTWAFPPAYEWNAKTLTGTYSNSVTGSYSDLVTFDAVTFDGAPVNVELTIPNITSSSAGVVQFAVREGAAVVTDGQVAPVPTGGASLALRFQVAPTAAAHTYKISWQSLGGTASINAASAGYVRGRIVKA